MSFVKWWNSKGKSLAFSYLTWWGLWVIKYLAAELHFIYPSSLQPYMPQKVWSGRFSSFVSEAPNFSFYDVSCVFTVSFHVAVPLLSRILPSDACKIYKQGINIRQVNKYNTLIQNMWWFKCHFYSCLVTTLYSVGLCQVNKDNLTQATSN